MNQTNRYLSNDEISSCIRITRESAKMSGCSTATNPSADYQAFLFFGPAMAVKKALASCGVSFDGLTGKIQRMRDIDGGFIGSFVVADSGRASGSIPYSAARRTILA